MTALAAALLAVFIAGRATQPVRQLTAVAERMANGDLDARLFFAGRDGMGQLTRAFDRMTDQIREQMSRGGWRLCWATWPTAC